MIPNTQRAIIISAPGGPEVLLENANWPVPMALADDDVLIHVGAALYHHFGRRDGLLRRMWFGK